MQNLQKPMLTEKPSSKRLRNIIKKMNHKIMLQLDMKDKHCNVTYKSRISMESSIWKSTNGKFFQ